MEDLGLLQAWGMWWDNVQVDQHTLYGWSILALGRAGKVLSFLGGMTLVIDLIGPERLRKFGHQHKIFQRSAFWLWTVLPFILASSAIVIAVEQSGDKALAASMEVLLFACLGIALLLYVPLFMPALVRGAARALEQPLTEKVARWLGFASLIVGFHFDLLAS